MADIHVYLTDTETTQLKRLAEKEDRSITNMARKLLREAMDTLERTEPTKTRKGQRHG